LHSDNAKLKMLWHCSWAFVKSGKCSVPNWNPIFYA
jgi:hypothetical protein